MVFTPFPKTISLFLRRLICRKPTHLLFAQMALVSTFYQIFIVLGMYNFDNIVQNINYLISSGMIHSGWKDVRLRCFPSIITVPKQFLRNVPKNTAD